MSRPASVLPLILAAAACAQTSGQTADTVYLNGTIYTVDDNRRTVEAVAITAGEFVRVGTTDEVRELIGESTITIDLDGRTVLPGLHDLHIHPIGGGTQALYSCNFSSTANASQIVAAVARCAEERPDQAWINGARWGSAVFPESNPHKSLLDAVVPDRPVILTEESGHLVWVNSKALELAGINKDTPDPEGGVIMRDPRTGEPTGVLKESASGLVRRMVPGTTAEELVEALRYAARTLNEHGVTSMKDAGAGPGSLDVYKTLDDAGELTVRVATSLALGWTPESRPQLLTMLDSRSDYYSDRLNTDFVKLMLDGVPTTAKTAAMLEPYVDDPHNPDNRGMLFIAQEDLSEMVTWLDSAGLTVKMHAAGDASVRAALNAIEAARTENGNSGLRHDVGHAGFVHMDDFPRFDRLGAVMEVSPYIWYPTPISDVSIREAVGDERTNDFWPVKSGVDAGAVVVAGSDWPVVPNLNPWRAIEAMVTRRDPDGVFDGTLAAHQAVDLKTAIDIFTVNGAYAMKQEDAVGSIEVGKRADFVVIDRNLFEIPADQIGETRVLTTVVDGEVVFERE